jgi:hypothetical protein
VATGVPRVAAADAECALDGAAEYSVLFNREDHVLTAAGVEAAVASQPGADTDLVEPYNADQQDGGQSSHSSR